MARYARTLVPGGSLLLSGFLMAMSPTCEVSLKTMGCNAWVSPPWKVGRACIVGNLLRPESSAIARTFYLAFMKNNCAHALCFGFVCPLWFGPKKKSQHERTCQLLEGNGTQSRRGQFFRGQMGPQGLCLLVWSRRRRPSRKSFQLFASLRNNGLVSAQPFLGISKGLIGC